MKKVRIIHDGNAPDPREWDNMGTIATKHQRYTIGEEQMSDPIEWLEGMLNLENKWEYTNQRLSYLEGLFFSRFIALPVYMYEHGGIALSTGSFSCRWDSGKLGYIYATKEKIRSEFSVKHITKKVRERAEAVLRAEIEILSYYVNGESYGFIVEEDGEEIDSCWGFYGTDWQNNGLADYLPEELKEQLSDVEIEYTSW